MRENVNPLSRFSNALGVALQELRLTQKEFAAACNLTPSQINRFVRGKNVGLASLETIARALPDAQRADVVAAWLRDALPQNTGGLVSILTAGRVAEESPEESAALAQLKPELNQAVRYLIAAARTHTEISDLLIDLEKALRGSKD